MNCGSPEAFALLLNYMYSGSVVISQSNVIPLLRLANNFLVSKLKNYCAEYLDRSPSPLLLLPPNLPIEWELCAGTWTPGTS